MEVLAENMLPRESDAFSLSLSGTEEVLCPLGTSMTKEEASRLKHFAAGRRPVSLPKGHQEAPRLHLRRVLGHYYSTIFLPLEEESRCRRFIRDYVLYRREILDVAFTLTQRLGRYHAVHVRRGDFGRYYPNAVPGPDRILRRLESVIPRGERLYVSTDERDRRFFAALADRYDLVFFADIAEAYAEALPKSVIACVEVLVCASADQFVGTYKSTFSGYIIRLRGYRGLGVATQYFINRAPLSLGDPAPGEYSWEPFVRAGKGAWQYEFPEGWTNAVS